MQHYSKFLDNSSGDAAVATAESVTPGLFVTVLTDADRAGNYAVFEPTKPGTLNKKAMYLSRMELQ